MKLHPLRPFTISLEDFLSLKQPKLVLVTQTGSTDSKGRKCEHRNFSQHPERRGQTMDDRGGPRTAPSVSTRRCSSSHEPLSPELARRQRRHVLPKEFWPPNSPDLNPLDFFLRAFLRRSPSNVVTSTSTLSACNPGCSGCDSSRQRCERLPSVSVLS